MGLSKGKMSAIAEVRLPGFTFPSRPGKVAVSIRIVQGKFKRGPAQLRSLDGSARSVTFLGVAFINPDFSMPGAREKWEADLQSGVVEALLDGVTADDLTDGDCLIQDE